MNRKIYISALLLFFLCPITCMVSCMREKYIPEETMSDIYYEMYITDQLIRKDRKKKKESDTLLVYEPIFERFGYTSEDYRNSVNHYLLKPEKFEKIFRKTQAKLELRKKQLEDIIAQEEERLISWNIADSITYYTDESIQSSGYFRAIRMLIFTPDTVKRLPDSPIYDSLYTDTVSVPKPTIFTMFSDSVYLSDYHFRFYTNIGIVIPLPIIEPMEEPESTASQEEKKDGKKENILNSVVNRQRQLKFRANGGKDEFLDSETNANSRKKINELNNVIITPKGIDKRNKEDKDSTKRKR